MKKYTLDDAIRMALGYAEKKNKANKLIRDNDEEFDWGNENNWEDGDPETIYSIGSLFANISNPEYLDDILDALIQKYPDFA